MDKIDASKLIQFLSTQHQKPMLVCVGADNPIFFRVAEHSQGKKLKSDFSKGISTNKKAKVFSGKNSIEEFVNDLSAAGFFEPPQDALVEFPEKLTAKQWNEAKKHLARLPSPVETTTIFFAAMALKNTIKLGDLPANSRLLLCYEPNEQDILKCALQLLLRYPSLAQKNKAEQTDLARLALESYTNDLVSCDMHFERMDKGNLTFSAALAGNPEVNGFHVAEALALKDKHLLELRLSQCAQCGEEAASVLMALVYFFKQVAHVLEHLSVTNNLRLAFDQAKIPYPAQARIQKTLSFCTVSMLASFFVAIAKVEMEMRFQKNPHAYLSYELIQWLDLSV